MWYDKYPGLPPRNTPLESTFVLVCVQRAEQQLLSTRALVQSTLQGGDASKPAIQAYQAYVDRMFPFLDKAAEVESEEVKALKEFVKYKAKINIGSVIASQVENSRRENVLRRSRIKPSSPGQPSNGLVRSKT